MSTSIDPTRGQRKRGGARPGAGRPPKDPTERRAKLTARVSPQNMSRLLALSERLGTSLSEALDVMLTGHAADARDQAHPAIAPTEEAWAAERRALLAELEAARAAASPADWEASTDSILRQAEAIAGLGSFEVARDTGEVRWSDGHYRLYGRPAFHKALSFDAIRPWLHPDDMPAVRQAFEAGFATGQPVEIEYRVLRPDGTQRRLRSTCQPVAGEPNRFVGVTQDMTNRLDAVRSLARSERQHRELVAHASVGLIVSDPAGRFLTVNPAAAALLGYGPDELAGMSFTDVVHPDELAVAIADLRGLGAADAEVRREQRYLRKDGTVLVADLTARSRPAEGDAPGYVVAMLRDATDERRAEAAGRQAEARFRALFEAAPIGIVLGDENGHCLEANGTFAAMLGYTPLELRAKVFTQYTHPDDVGHDWAAFKALVAGEVAPYALDKRYMAKDGRIVTAHLTMSRVAGEGGAPGFVVAMVQDITERRRAEAANARLRESERYKDEFLAVVNHELRTPLNFIMGFASVLDDGLAGPLTAPQRRHLGRIQQGADRLNAMVDDMLLVAQVDAGTLTLDRQPVGYVSLCREAVADVAAEADRRGVTVTTEVATAEPVSLDALRIKRAIAALLENAVKFSPSGGRVWLRARLEDGQCLTEIEDEGPGIAPADQPRVFERFHQLDMSVTRAQGGAGLGLAIAKGFVEAHGGVIGVDSAPGRGSIFWFTLPLGERSSS